MYDVIVVGARCAGAAAAMLLARRGWRVLAVDRATFPSDTLSTHYVQQPAVARLRDWGLLDALARTGCPPVPIYALDLGFVALEGRPTPCDGVSVAYGPRRTVLDALLVEAAGHAGAEVRTGVRVEGLLVENGAVTGVRARGAGGAQLLERARFVVGADGLHSIVARTVGAPAEIDHGTLQCAYYAYWSDLPASAFAGFARPGRAAATIPTHDGLTCVPVVFPRARFDEVRRDVGRHYLAALDSLPLGERIRAARRETPIRGTGDLPNRLVRPHGPGWALIGDAGCHQDPVTAHGITNAFRDADQLAEALDRGLGGAEPLEAALAEFHRRRDAEARPMLELTRGFASGEPPSPEHVALLRALAGDAPARDRYFGMLAGTVPPDEFLAPENVAAIMAGAGAAAAG